MMPSMLPAASGWPYGPGAVNLKALRCEICSSHEGMRESWLLLAV